MLPSHLESEEVGLGMEKLMLINWTSKGALIHSPIMWHQEKLNTKLCFKPQFSHQCNGEKNFNLADLLRAHKEAIYMLYITIKQSMKLHKVNHVGYNLLVSWKVNHESIEKRFVFLRTLVILHMGFGKQLEWNVPCTLLFIARMHGQAPSGTLVYLLSSVYSLWLVGYFLEWKAWTFLNFRGAFSKICFMEYYLCKIKASVVE